MPEWKRRMNLRHDIYFSLTKKQQKKLHELGYQAIIIENVSMNDFKKLTKNTKLIYKLQELKRMFIRSVA